MTAYEINKGLLNKHDLIMKELSIEQKAKCYDEALERAKSVIEQNPLMEYLKKGIEYIFPVLKESEDEKIKGAIIHFISHTPTVPKGIIGKKTMLAWLEKQGDKPQGKSALEAIKEEKVDNRNYIKLIDKIEPKFKVGDWIVYKDTVYKVCNISLLNYYELLKINNEVSTRRIEDVDKNARLWTIQDAKDGNVLADMDRAILLFRGVGNNKWSDAIDYYALLETNMNNRFSIQEGDDYWGRVDYCSLCPATKEQCVLLFQKMKEAGYEWDAEKKKLKKIEQNPAWSEEDEKILDGTIELIEKANHPNIMHSNGKPLDFTANINFLKSLKDRVQPKVEWSEEDEEEFKIATETLREAGQYSSANWLKSLRPQPKQEWSQNDIDMIDWLIRCCEKEHEELCNDKYGHQDIVSDLKRDCRKKWDWLESLKNRVAPQNTWKPSEEQIKTCKEVYADILSAKGFDLGTINSELNRLEEELKKLKE